MNNTTVHLIMFLAALVAVVLLVITGHENNPVIAALLAGVVGGSGGITFGNLVAPVAAVNRQAGFSRISIFVVLFLMCAFVTGCNYLGAKTSGTGQQQIESLCAGTSATIKALTVVEPAFSAAEDKTVSDAIAVINPICNAPEPPTYSSVEYAALTAAVGKLATLQVKYHANTTGG